MKHLQFTVPVLISLVIIGLISTLLWFRTPQFGQWAKNQYFGEVVKLQDSSILLQGKNTDTIKIFYDRNTKIMKGTHEIESTEIPLNTPVIVIAQADAAGELHARAIRIFAPKKP